MRDGALNSAVVARRVQERKAQIARRQVELREWRSLVLHQLEASQAHVALVRAWLASFRLGEGPGRIQ
jgi:hypothetical protein